jgi:hypothetical protein
MSYESTLTCGLRTTIMREPRRGNVLQSTPMDTYADGKKT